MGKHLALFLAFVIAVAIVDLALYTGIAVYELHGSVDTPDARTLCERVCAEFAERPDGTYEISDEGAAYLDEEGAWGLLAGPQCETLWSYRVPDGVDMPDSAQDFAMLAHYGYHDDYPVFVYTPSVETSEDGTTVLPATDIERAGLEAIGEDKLLVVGYPPESYVMMPSLSLTESDFNTLTRGALLILVVNLLMLLVVYLASRRSIVRALVPLSLGIERLAKGDPARVDIAGDLSDIADDVNAAADVIRRKDEARANWISGISHDVRTPLSSVLGYADRIAQDEGNPERTRAEAAIVRAQALRMRDLVEDLNLATKLEYDLQPLETKERAIAALLRETVAAFVDTVDPDRYPIELEVCSASESVRLDVDERLFARAVRNLLQNSVAHNPDGCHITVSLIAEAGVDAPAPIGENGDIGRLRASGTRSAWCITVSDDGVGADSDKLAHLRCGPSSLGDATERRDDGFAAHGLGLLLVRGIVSVHGGSLLLDSPGEGKGFSATMSFPQKAR